MSTQFRSRIKTVIDYSVSAAATGGCCLPDGTKLTGDDITVSECNRQNGFFRAGDPTLLQCPDRGLTGCCCACSYIREQEGDFDTFLDTVLENPIGNDGTDYHQKPVEDDLDEYGYKDNVTQCECFNRQGNWFYGKCNEVEDITSLCGSIVNRTDVRVPAACCHENSTTNEINCDNVCTAKECSDLSVPTSGSSGGTSIYYGSEAGGNGGLCVWDYKEEAVQCGSAVNNTNRTSPFTSNPEETLRTCFELVTENDKLIFKCSQKVAKDCYDSNGYQYPDNNLKSGLCSDYSSLMYPPQRGSGSLRVIPPTISSSVVLPNVGEHYQGGMYIGTFMPGGSVGLDPSTVRRRSNNRIEEVPARGDGSGTNKKKWALIYSYKSFGNLQLEKAAQTNKGINRLAVNAYGEMALAHPTSFYDGFFNTYGDGTGYGGYNSKLFEDIRSLTFNGFNDWYIPSIDELSFIYKNYKLTQFYYDNNGSKSPFNGIQSSQQYKNMASSTLYSENDKLGKSDEISGQMVGSKGYLYAQNMRDDGKGKREGLVYKSDRRSKLVIPLVRRIYID